ncbi:Arginine utilization regulatory protein RocR [Pelotomaculum sp. FP]|uniref:sigma-54 interaction domain-containing protein n=1 Tax=Pelotomaculum sp. FP TaxID=261474 RepID=UPI001066B8ED|nr:sigma 54-interacting transcriptional regulator [Pelotomaculum sp. FP]TEB18036.1 Arginine utilization regulatory protein RocR [Pelotomaculum sp. FP]
MKKYVKPDGKAGKVQCCEWLDVMSDLGIIVVDKNGIIIFYNTTASVFDKVDKETAIGKHYTDLYCDKDGGCIKAVFDTGKPVYDMQNEWTSFYNQKFTSLDSAYPVWENGEIVSVVATTKYPSYVKSLFRKAIDSRQIMISENKENSNGTRYTFNNIIGEDLSLKVAVKQARKAASSLSPVLLEGETGTGKEIFAQSIHNASECSSKPFIAINCAAIPENLLEGMLFGTTKGAFTNAENSPGLFETAKGGTFFLDEINSMPLNLQAKLLRVIQEKKVRRIGSNVEHSIECRFISSTNKPPVECIKNNTLRDDLYYRLSVISIRIPPLRERIGDIRIFAEYFADKFAEVYLNKKVELSQTFLEALDIYNWPGNVRELEHMMESIVVMLEPGETITFDNLPIHIKHLYKEHSQQQMLNSIRSVNEMVNDCAEECLLKDTLLKTQREVILSALASNNWNISRSARAIGISRTNLQYRMKRMKIENPNKK